MAFRFPLQSLLRFRQSLEHHEQMLLQAANQKVSEVRRKIDSLEQCQNRRSDLQRQGLSAGLSGAELQFDTLCNAALEDYRHVLENELVQLEKLRDKQEEVFRRARMQREILESIRDVQLRAYQAEKNRREQRSLDDLFLMRREFLRREH